MNYVKKYGIKCSTVNSPNSILVKCDTGFPRTDKNFDLKPNVGCLIYPNSTISEKFSLGGI
jgi:hypothetical protein